MIREKIKREVLLHYSINPEKPICSKCGFDDIRALSIDHINGGGNIQREFIHENFYRWLIKNNYPEGYQVLCMNCQFIKRKEQNENRKN